MKEEMVDIVDKENKVVDTVTRKEMRKKNLMHRSVYFLIFNSKGETLVAKRSETKDIDPGLYETPGACVSAGETYEEAAHREIEEEFGINDANLKFLFDITYEDEHRKEISKAYSLVYDGEIIPQQEEIESYFFISLDKLMNKIKENKLNFCENRIKLLKKYLEMKK